MVANVDGTSLIGQELTEIRYFLFCFNFSHFAVHIPLPEQNIIFKFKTQEERRKRQDRRGLNWLTRLRRVGDETVIQTIRGNDQKLK